MAFEADVRRNEGVVVLELHGEVDGAADEAINTAYEEAIAHNPKTVLINFDAVSYINSTGIALIVGLLAEARSSDRNVSVCGLSDHYKEIFEITRISDFVTMFADEQSAVAKASQS
ncbi:MAG TPA: STAS domain-containing protein [Actinomycetota bacterium]|jgi:anti-anti-sigma factor|nr:STAS domain-containing protein [Actinomycetota bacterium]